MKWMNHLYIGDLAEKEKEHIIRRIRKKKLLAGTYVLMPASNSRDQVDIMQANFLLQPWIRSREDAVIVGIAEGRGDAMNLLMRITDECWRSTGTANLREFLARRIREEGTREIV